MDRLAQDVRSALRSITRHPGFASLVLFCLALGIGLNTAIFSVVDTLLIRPLPYRDPDGIVFLFDVTQGADGKPEQYNASSQNFLDWQEQSSVFERLVAMESTFLNLTGGEPERVATAAVSDGFFELLGVRAVRGRTFLPEEDRPGGPLVAMISHAFWQRRFGGGEIVGRPLVLDGKTYTVVGVVEPRFHFRREADLWVPLAIDEAHQPEAPTTHYLFTTARLKPGVSREQAQAEMAAIASRLARERPESNGLWSVEVVSLRENLVGRLRVALVVVLAAVGFLLLIACANVGNLLLIRATGQRAEVAVRTALGADRSRIVRLILTESTVLALLGGALGLALAAAAVRALPLIGPRSLIPLPEVHVDLRVTAFALLVSLLTGLIPALPAAFQAAGPDLPERIQGGSLRATEGVPGRRLQGGLVVAEIALALVLLVCAGLTLKSFRQLYQTSPGFTAEDVLMAQVSLPEWKYREPDQIVGFWRDLLPRVQALPGVVAAGTTHALPVNDFVLTTVFVVEGRAPANPDETLMANFRKVSPGFFRTLEIPLLEGRAFGELEDGERPLAAVISREMARRYWPGESAVGKRIRRGPNPKDWTTIVGVAGDVYDGPLGAEFGNTIYIPLAQAPKSANPTVHLLVRTSVEPASLAGEVRRAVLSVDRDQAIDRISTMEEWVATSLSSRRFSTLLLALFAGLGVILAVTGIYGVLSYAVSRRRHEIGVRMALGARTDDITRMVLRQGLKLTTIGLAIGLAAALAAGRLLTSLLYQVEPADPAIFAGITAGLVAVAALASWLPARRAARVDPARSLRQE